MTDAPVVSDASVLRDARLLLDAPVVVAARRTPIAPRGRGLRSLTVDQLAAPVLRASLVDGFEALGGPHALGDVVLGNCMGPGGNPARVAALAAGFDVSVPGAHD